MKRCSQIIFFLIFGFHLAFLSLATQDVLAETNCFSIAQLTPSDELNTKIKNKISEIESAKTRNFSGILLFHKAGAAESEEDFPCLLLQTESGNSCTLFFCGSPDKNINCPLYMRAEKLIGQKVLIGGILKRSDPEGPSDFTYLEVQSIEN